MFYPRTIERPLFAVIMVAAALLACARSEIDEAEIYYRKAKFSTIGLSKYIAVDAEYGIHIALAKIRATSKDLG